MSMPKMYVVFGVACAGFAVFATWLIAGFGSTDTRAVSDLGSVLAGLFATVCAGFAARSSRGRQRRAWGALMIGLFGWVVGDAIWAYYELWRGMDVAPFPSLADAGYLLFTVGATLALILFPIGNSGQSQVRLLLDGLIVAGSLFVVSWVTILRGVFDAGDETRFAFWVSLAYPIADLMMLTMALLVLTRARTGQRAAVTLLTAGIAVMALSDSAFVYLNADDDYASGHLVDVGWVAGLLLLGLAALVASRSPQSDLWPAQVPSRMSLWLPYVPLPLAAIVGSTYLLRSPGSVPVLIAAVLLVIIVLGRQFIVVDDNRRLLVKVADQALRDPLTGLANRALFQDRLTHAVALQLRDAREVAVLSLDLDDFKLVNDCLGHPAGDALLTAVAERILGCVRTGDTVARLGGDEFAILIEDGPDPPLVLAHRVLDAFDQPFLVEGQELFMRPSVGLASGASADELGVSPDGLLKQADLAMYSAKRARTGGVKTFTADMHLIDLSELDLPRHPDDPSRGNGSAGMQLLGQLRRAIDNGQLSLVYQPKFSVPTGEIVGVEALVRWPHPERGLLMPDQFLPMVRQHGLMGAVTDLVLTLGIRDAAEWHAHGVGVPFAVNLFPPSLSDLELPTRIARMLAEQQLTTDFLTVEVTEDLLVGNIARTRKVLNRLREYGIRIALDDFGSGYSALSYLRELPIDELKLDREFIAPILDDNRAAAIVRAVIDLAHTLGMTSVAEGVEDAATAARLGEFGCDVIQGHYCSPPVPAQTVLQLLLSSPRYAGAPLRS